MSGTLANRTNGDRWRADRKPVERGKTVRNRRKPRLNGKRHYRES